MLNTPPVGMDQHLKNVDTAFLFGAGTSAHMRLSQSQDSASVPTDTSFFEVVKDGTLEKWCTDRNILSIARQARERVFGALRYAGMSQQQLFLQPGKTYPDVRLEEVFCRLEMLRMLGQYIPARNELRDGWAHPVEALRDLTAITMAYGRPCAGNPNETGYTGFVQRVLRGHHRKAANTCAVLSLNYEIGIESATRRWFDQDESTFPETRRIARSLDGDHVGTQSLFHYALPNRWPILTSEAMPILKLHGSCNWGFCPECENVLHVAMEIGSHGCMIETLVGPTDDRQACHWHSADHPLLPRYVPDIVPPTWNKWIGDYTMRHIWRQAYGVVCQCRRLFVVGTSLPETDLHLRHLLRVALAQNKKRPQVYLVNPIKQEDRSGYKQRAEATVGLTIPDDNCFWERFEEEKTLDWIFDRVHEHTEKNL